MIPFKETPDATDHLNSKEVAKLVTKILAWATSYVFYWWGKRQYFVAIKNNSFKLLPDLFDNTSISEK